MARMRQKDQPVNSTANGEPTPGDAHEPETAAADTGPQTPPQVKQPSVEAAPDPYRPDSLRLKQDFGAPRGRPLLLTVPCLRTNDKSTYIRVRPEPEYTMATVLMEVAGDDNSCYLIGETIQEAMEYEPACAPWQLYTALNRQGTLYLWRVRLPGRDGRDNSWWTSAHEAAALAGKGWVRIVSNQNLKAYEVWPAKVDLGEPKWPDNSFHELLKIAFKNTLINSLDHPVLRRLRGEA
jgi:hypothetical protein